MPKNKKIPKNYKCESCDYQTTHKTKYIRHCDTLKHKIAMNGITCCGFTYYQKHKWINHKKSTKHTKNRK